MSDFEERLPVIRLDLSWIIETMRSVDALLSVSEEDKGGYAWSKLYDAKNKLNSIFSESVYGVHLKISRSKAFELLKIIDPIMTNFPMDGSFEEYQVWQLTNATKNFRTVFLSELSTLPAYIITPKQAYDIDALTDNGALMFPPDMGRKCPEASEDASEAGSCLAFERNTACGFHTFRVVEAVLKRYWDVVTSGLDRPNPQSLGKMAADLANKKLGDQKTVESLKQLAKLHRNPIAHPEVILTSDEAISVLGMARSVLTEMLKALPDVPPTTTAP